MEKNQISGCLGQNVAGVECNGAKRELIRMIELFHIFVRVMVIHLLHWASGWYIHICQKLWTYALKVAAFYYM